MFGWVRKWFGRAVFLEAGAAIIFFGSLVHQPELADYGTRALHELRLRGYEIPTADDPVRVYPASTAGAFSGSHAGGWRPGIIALRQNPQGSLGVEVYLRHELMHEASHRTCRGKLPLWAEEAAAVSFAMASSYPPPATGDPGGSPSPSPVYAGAGVQTQPSESSRTAQPTALELENLRRRVRVGAGLDQEAYHALTMLLSCYGWPTAACARSETIEKLLTQPPSPEETGFSYLLVSLISGRTLESQGDLKSRHPPGSLLKIPYAAALRRASEADPPTLPQPLPSSKGSREGTPLPLSEANPSEALGKELAASDTEKLLARRSSFDLERFRLLISPVRETALGVRPVSGPFGSDERGWRQYLGERGADGNFPLEATLPELALVLRASLLYQPEYFVGLSRNGFSEGSTLYRESDHDKRILDKLHALSKTGTVADARGQPLIGHLMVAWPAEDPAFLAVFRVLGVNGAANVRRASRILEKWAGQFPTRMGKVRVRLLTLAPRSTWEVLDECPAFERENIRGWKERVSTCGRFRIVSTARGSRPERLVAGVLSNCHGGEQVVLETDPETYADAVLAAEAQELKGEAQKALRAVIVWNGTHGGHRHEDSASLCDTTHCMVFQGTLPEAKPERSNHTDPKLLKLLDELAGKKKLDWLPFSKGGTQPWVKEVPASSLLALVDEPSILELRRERTRGGNVVIHLMYPDNEEIVPCEVFRNRLKLLSCPETLHHDGGKSSWIFSGIGEGHGQGISVSRAAALARAGQTAAAILRDAFQ